MWPGANLSTYVYTYKIKDSEALLQERKNYKEELQRQEFLKTFTSEIRITVIGIISHHSQDDKEEIEKGEIVTDDRRLAGEGGGEIERVMVVYTEDLDLQRDTDTGQWEGSHCLFMHRSGGRFLLCYSANVSIDLVSEWLVVSITRESTLIQPATKVNTTGNNKGEALARCPVRVQPHLYSIVSSFVGFSSLFCYHCKRRR